MARSGYLCVLVGLAALAGCRSKPYVNAHIESLNAEYRQLEDYVYALEEENGRLQQERDALRAGTIDRTRRDPPAAGRPGVRARPDSDVPRIEVPRARADETEPPSIEIPDVPAAPLPAPRPMSTPLRSDAAPSQPGDRRVTSLFVNPLHTTADSDEGLSVVLQPRNGQAQYVPEAGAVSVVALDPARQGEAARVARWDLDQTAIAQLLSRTGHAPGIKIDLPWPDGPPASERLKLFVRYETADGRKVEADEEVAVVQHETVVSRWTPRPPERQRPAVDEPRVAAAEPAVTAASHHTPLKPASPREVVTPADLSAQRAEQPPLPRWSPHR